MLMITFINSTISKSTSPATLQQNKRFCKNRSSNTYF